MLQKRRIGHSRRNLAVEALEDRTVLSGNLSVFQSLFTGAVQIQNTDNGNHNYSVTQTLDLGFPTLSVTGSTTAVNFIPNGTANFPLATVSEIDVTEGNGTNTISMSNFPLLGNINIRVGNGVNNVSLSRILTNAGQITFANLPSPAVPGGTHTITEDTIVAGNSVINMPAGKLTVAQNNVTFGFDTIVAGNDSISITNSRFAPTPRTSAIGQLNILSLSGDNSINVNNISVGPASIRALGNGKDTIKFDNSTMQFASVTNGSAAGANTSSVDISNDIITGEATNPLTSPPQAALTVNLLNPSGVGNASDALGTIYHLTMNNVQFTGGGNMAVTVNDGVPYEGTDSAGNPTLKEASTVAMSLIDTSGSMNISLGNHFQVATLGVGTIGVNDLDASSLRVNIGRDNDIVVVSANIVGDGDDEIVTIGDVTTNHLGGAATPVPSVLVNGIWVNDGDENLTLNLGNNNNTNLVSGWPVTVNETVSGNLTIRGLTPTVPPNGPNGLALTVGKTTVSGLLSIALGSGGVNKQESLTLDTVSTSDLTITANTAVGDVPDGNPNAGLTVNMTNVVVADAFGGLSFADFGTGVDTVTMTNVAVVNMLLMTLSNSSSSPFMTGNFLTAKNVTCAFGMIDGGGLGFGNLYLDLGGNFGYFVIDFYGH